MTTPTEWQKLIKSSYLPSNYQCDFFEWIVNGSGNAVVNAVAGAGKTSSIIFGARLIVSDAVYIAFSKAVVDEIEPKLEGTNMTARTAYSIGFGAIRFCNRNINVQVEDPKRQTYKYKSVISQIENDLKRNGGFLFGKKLDYDEMYELRGGSENGEIKLPSSVIMSLFDKARLSLIDFDGRDYPNILWDLANHHNIDCPQNLDRVISDIIKYLADYGKKNISLIDFVDMVWLPHVNRYTPKKFSWVFVDECQDTSPAQLDIIKKCTKRGGRIVAIGDPFQSIFGFAGADANSFNQIIKDLKAKILPLSVCYRCPTSGINLAKRWVPQIEARPNAPEGTVSHIKYDEMKDMVREGDMILCRKNAPLVGAAFTIISKGIPAVVKGRAIGEGLTKIIKAILKTNNFDSFGQGIESWLEKEKNLILSRGGDESSIQQKIMSLDDSAECLRIIYQRKEVSSIQDINNAITDLFSDNRASVTLSSIHRSKGLENKRIFILGPTEISFKGQKQWMKDQESNLSYVAHTRHMEDLVYVEEKGKESQSNNESNSSAPFMEPIHALLPTRESMSRARLTAATGENFMTHGDYSSADVFNASNK